MSTKKLNEDKTIFGFWLYLMNDIILFATLFATFMVLRENTYGGPSGKELFSLPFVLVETLLLLTSSFTAGIAIYFARQKNRKQVLVWLVFTALLGLGFLAMELHEFSNLVSEGHGWQTSAFLSAFFTLVGTHGLHITIGLMWLIYLVISLYRAGFTDSVLKRLTLFSLFWHFLDIIWIFIFTIVYLMGEVNI